MSKEKFHETRVGRIVPAPYVYGSEAVEFETQLKADTLQVLTSAAIDAASGEQSQDTEIAN